MNLTQTTEGLHSDNSVQTQPKDTYRFALNAVNETGEGDLLFRSNEESNEECVFLKLGYVPIGKCYISNSETVIFSVSEDNLISEIGILNNNCKYQVLVNDTTSSVTERLNFQMENQIQATYTLRKGCERIIYFTDNFNKPRFYNIDKPENFKTNSGNWNQKEFNLFKEYNLIPKFSKIAVLNSGGNLEPGSYNISVQYLDEGFNTSEWIFTSPVINIYNSDSDGQFLEINGSINSEEDYINFPTTSKAIRVDLTNLDENFTFYRLAFIEATSGTGNITKVKYSEVIPTSKKFYLYTGIGETLGTEEEILFFNNVIEKASSIEQIENRLLLANTEGKQVNFCGLQKYASRINADVVIKNINHSSVKSSCNSKNATVHFGDLVTGGTGYMPGEIYSFGIVYVFKDGTLSPAYHIPGKSDLTFGQIFSPELVVNGKATTYPMSTVNKSISGTYIENNSCSSSSYWGLDGHGEGLTNTLIRHHKFPLRSEMNLPLVVETVNPPVANTTYRITLNAVGTIVLPKKCTQADLALDPGCTDVVANEFKGVITFTLDGLINTMVVSIIPGVSDYALTVDLDYETTTNSFTSPDIIITKIEEINDANVITLLLSPTQPLIISPKGVYYFAAIVPTTTYSQEKQFFSDILGIKFSNIDIPNTSDTNGEEIVGYYIVRNERIESEKTILDSAVLVPTMNNSKYTAHGLLMAEDVFQRRNYSVAALINPEFKFNKKEYTSFDYIKKEGSFDAISNIKSNTLYNDVMDGTSFVKDDHADKKNDDGAKPTNYKFGLDGWSLKVLFRDNILKFKNNPSAKVLKAGIKEVFYLKALESKTINNEARIVFNTSCDNRVGIVHFVNDYFFTNNNLPYVILGRDLAEPYSNFRTAPYYLESLNMETFDSNTKKGTSKIFNGDTYITPMRYVNTIFWDNRIAKRTFETTVVAYVVGGLLVAAGILALVFSAGLSFAPTSLIIGAGITLIGGGALFTASGIEKSLIIKAYGEDYQKGLKETSADDYVFRSYSYGGFVPNPPNGKDGPSDDEIQWIADCLTDLWFESTVNISLRNKMVVSTPTFLDAPGIIESGSAQPQDYVQLGDYDYYKSGISRYPESKLERHINNKLLVFNPKRKDNREYIGVGLGEYYNINPDYQRINKQKIYYHLALEYDCCSKCNETFPNRWHWSEQSFQETLSDNYRVFLPNNYKDIQGESGVITNMFKLNNDLFIHTEEGLYQIPRNYQERVTDQITSFIGTGSYGEIPARKMIDDETGNSAGTTHKWSSIKTSNGYFFICENQKAVYMFDGKSLKPISNSGLSSWFKNNMTVNMDRYNYNNTGKKYKYRDNPSNKFGTGFISTYDSRKERIIITKKDFLPSNILDGVSDYDTCSLNGELTVFYNYQATINEQINDGWEFVGVEDCTLKFKRSMLQNVSVKTTKQVFHPAQTVYGPDPNCAYVIRVNVNSEFNLAGTVLVDANNNPILDAGGLFVYVFKYTKCDGTIVSTFACNNNACSDLTIPCFPCSGEVFQSYAVNACLKLPLPIGAVLGPVGNGDGGIPYPSCPPVATFIPEFYTTEDVFTITKILVTEYSTISGEVINNAKALDASWTISYSLKQENWVSLHSYLPNFYINTPNKFYSWINGNDNIWKHNKENEYQKFYGVIKPFILEYISLSQLQTKVWESLALIVDVKKYNASTDELYDVTDTFFNKMIAYNSRQCTGLLNIKVKNKDQVSTNYLNEQVTNLLPNQILVDKNEKHWTLNELRDIRVNYNTPIFNSNLVSIQTDYFIDKILNTSSLNFNKNWTELESFRDKYLVIRLIFDNIADNTVDNGKVKIIMNFSGENEIQSFR